MAPAGLDDLGVVARDVALRQDDRAVLLAADREGSLVYVVRPPDEVAREDLDDGGHAATPRRSLSPTASPTRAAAPAGSSIAALAPRLQATPIQGRTRTHTFWTSSSPLTKTTSI